MSIHLIHCIEAVALMVVSSYLIFDLYLSVPRCFRHAAGVCRNWQGAGLHDEWLLRRIAALVMDRVAIPAVLVRYDETRYRRNVAKQAAWRITEASREHGLGSPTEGYLVTRRAINFWHRDIELDRDVTEPERLAALDLVRVVVEETVARYLEIVSAGRGETPVEKPEETNGD